MVNAEHIEMLKQDVIAWNRWRNTHRQIRPQLEGADLRSSHLRNADLTEADLSQARLTEADLTDVDFTRADLRGADLRAAKLTRAWLIGCDMTGADLRYAILDDIDLREADIRGVMFRGGDLGKANLTSTKVGWTTFADLNLRDAVGLDAMRHLGPSSIGVDTIYRSQGKISEAFLRAAGVPNTFVIYMKSLLDVRSEFYSCFISYASQDQEFAERLHGDIRAKGLRCWFAPEDLKIGDRFHERIEESIHIYDKVMIVLSESSVRSRWVEREVSAAREREDRENRLVLFPIRIDDVVMDAPQPWAADIRRTRHIGDFQRWRDHDSYLKALDRLVRDLRADGTTPVGRDHRTGKARGRTDRASNDGQIGSV